MTTFNIHLYQIHNIWIHSRVLRHTKNLEYTTHIQENKINQYTIKQNFIVISKDAKSRSAFNKIEHTFIIKLSENLEEKVTSSTY